MKTNTKAAPAFPAVSPDSPQPAGLARNPVLGQADPEKRVFGLYNCKRHLTSSK
jgi:hypothetical protein